MNDQSRPFLATVEDLSLHGLGVLKSPQGKIVFVPGVWPGDQGYFVQKESKKNYSFGQLIRLVSSSPDRIQTPCPHHGFDPESCGGCPWMMASYSSQLHQKQKLLETYLNRAQLIHSETKINPIRGSSQPLSYRNRVQLKTDGHLLGFVSAKSKQLVPIKNCLVLNPKTQELLKGLIDLLPQKNWQPFDQRQWNKIEFDDSFSSPLEIHINQSIPFRQAHDELNDYMKEYVFKWCSQLEAHLPLIELFCGSGNFTQVLLQQQKHPLLGVEIEAQALTQLNKLNSHNLSTQAMNIFDKNQWTKIKKWNPKPSYLLLDPPRGGFPQLDQFFQYFPTIKNILYISCDLQALLRDSKKLSQQGWYLKEIQPLDPFPQTPHMEIMVQLTNIKGSLCHSNSLVADI